MQIFNSEVREQLVHDYLNLYAIIKSSQISIMVVGGELIVQNEAEIFGAVLKAARQEAGLTVEALAERIGVSERYIYRLENNGSMPGYALLYKLIRELAISPDLSISTYVNSPFNSLIHSSMACVKTICCCSTAIPVTGTSGSLSLSPRFSCK